MTLRVRHRGEPEHEVGVEYPDVTMRSVSSLTGSGDERKRMVELRGPTDDVAAYLDGFRDHEAVIEAEPLSPLDGSAVYVAAVVDASLKDSVAERLSDLGVHYRTGTTIRGGVERWTLYLESDDDLSAVMRSLERGGNDVALARNVELAEIDRPPQLELTGFLEDLTRRQREVLATAIEMGYYEHGGDVGVEAVADDLDLGTTTVWEHLSRAEAKVMAGLVDRLDA